MVNEMQIEDTRSPGLATDTGLSWSQPVADLWVANNDGEYAGIVEFVDGHFIVRSQTGSVITISTSIPSGQRALAAHVRSLSQPATARLFGSVSAAVARRPFLDRRHRPGYVRATLQHS